MTGRTHDIIAFASILTVASIYPPQSLNVLTATACLVSGVIGALSPDMDQATNRLWDLLPAGNLVGKILRHLMLGHRTISHSILGLFIYYKFLEFIVPKILNPAYINGELVFYCLMIGAISHIAADSLTKEGIPLFFPLKIQIGVPPIRKLRITTGKFVESVLIFPTVLVYIFWLVYEKQTVFIRLLGSIHS